MFSQRNCLAFKPFTFLSCFKLTFKIHCLNMHTLFHPSGSKPPNYKWNDFLNGRCCMKKPKEKHAPTVAYPEGSMPRHVRTATARSSLLAALIPLIFAHLHFLCGFFVSFAFTLYDLGIYGFLGFNLSLKAWFLFSILLPLGVFVCGSSQPFFN